MKTSPVVCAVDIQTAGNKENAIIYSIGAYAGNILTGESYGTFYERCAHKQAGRGSCEEKLDAWEELRGKPCHREAFDPKLNRKPLPDVLHALTRFINSHAGENNEENGVIHLLTSESASQAGLLLHAMRQADIEPVWQSKYQDSLVSLDYVYRLLFNQRPGEGLSFDGYQGVAKYEAKHLFKQAHVILRRLHERSELSAIL